jgi:hypothetical protein
MIFRNKDGKLIELNRYDYKNDHIYYKKIMILKNENKNNESLKVEKSYSNIIIQNMLNALL